MKKFTYYFSTILAILLAIPNSYAEGEIEPKVKTEKASTVTAISAQDIFQERTTISNLGNFVNISSNNVSFRGNDNGNENYQNADINNTYMVKNNHGINYGLEYSRSAFLPKNNLDYSYRASNLKLGYLYGDNFNTNLNYYGIVNFTFGLGKDKFMQNTGSMGGTEEFETKYNTFGYEIGAGAIASPFDNPNLLVRAQADYDRSTDYYDKFNEVKSNFCISFNTIAKTGCDDYFCKMKGDGDFTLPESVLNRHTQGNFSFTSNNPVWISFGTETKKYDDDRPTQDLNNFSAGLDLCVDYYVADNIKLMVGVDLERSTEKNKDTEYNNSRTQYGINFGLGANVPSDDWLNNLSGNIDFKIGKDKQETKYTAETVPYSSNDNIFNYRIYAQYEHPITEGVDFYGNAGFESLGRNDTDSDNSYKRNGAFVEFGFKASFRGARLRF